MIDGPNLTVQINSFEQLIKQNVFSIYDVKSSTVLVNTGGNDYITLLLKDKNLPGIDKLIKLVVDELIVNLRRIHSLGVEKIILSQLEPIGCYPAVSVASSYHECKDSLNKISRDHNKALLQNVENLNKESGKPIFKTLDLYNSFLSVIEDMQKSRKGNSTLMNPLQECCAPLKAGYKCGEVDEKGQKKYSLCNNPELSLFWDYVHPTQNGWYSIFNKLEPSLETIYS
ncbi:putative SGNH hydrolase-type esterase domain-containing protein [Lupinus albus]|uniref:Putative SGNH hydrolase-type esterase domain-containing protein n=1 Tax=Lupinus albus TaxID=3870 RepID=A0A6A4R1J1_LUPAL|nr:putative SGNH hydrolase-type esterase domain-containing protein [Lupinus albus]